MKNHWSFKLLALILLTVSAAATAVSGLSVFANVAFGNYGSVTLDKQIQEHTEYELKDFTYQASMSTAVDFLTQQNTAPGTVERDIWVGMYNYTWHETGIFPEYEYTIYNEDGKIIASTRENVEYIQAISTTVYVEDGIITDLGSARKEFPEYEDLPANYQWTSYKGDELPGLDSRTIYYELIYGGDYGRVYRAERFPDVPLTVEVFLTEADIEQLSYSMCDISIMKAAYNLRSFDIPVLVISAIVLLSTMLYLCFASGKKPGTEEILPRGTNRIPLDLFVFLDCIPAAVCLMGGVQFMEATRFTSNVGGVYWYMAGLAAFAAGLALSVILFLMALCAQVRQGGGAWYKQTLIGRCGRGVWNFCKKVIRKVFAIDLLKKCWYWARSAGQNLPLMWQWALGLVGIFLAGVLASMMGSAWAFLLVLVVGLPLVLYAAHGFGQLRDAAKRMSQGDLDTKIDVHDEFLYGNFAEFAEDLNNLGDTCVDAALAKMKSERMKSELITNVSHDIKTPLTSIINYVDLLQQAETEEQRKEYLEVLDRQSQRLKKLIEDLMEMSKASSGNINAELCEGDIIEAVNQALGEFADRMKALDLNVIFRQREESIEASFDGKLLWRVMSNILSNVVKYALPGTRVYVDVSVTDSKVYVSFKNISREPLNITADELMERFVRGDESRNSEGNGLGLNIARSLMEVQGGDLDLTVDGDLFKVTLTLN